MPIIEMTVDATGASVTACDSLGAALERTGGPITIMVHGYKYQPHRPGKCPFQSLYAPTTAPIAARARSWPRRLGLRGQADEPLAIGFGWPARGTPAQVYARAARAGAALARALQELRAAAPGRPLRLIGHSMGARVGLQAMLQADRPVLDRMVLLAGADYIDHARAALDSPGAAGCAVLNVASGENDLFDFLCERLLPPPRPGARMLGAAPRHLRAGAGAGMGADMGADMVTVQLDDPRSLDGLKRLGFPIAPPTRRVCHWSAYMRAGVFPLYRAFLDGSVTPDTLAGALNGAPRPRWHHMRLPPLMPTLGTQ